MRRNCFVMAEKQEYSSALDFHTCSSRLVCPLSLVSLLICTVALVRVEIINQRVHGVEDLVVDARQNHNIVKFSTDTASFKRSEKVESAREFDHKITEEREDVREGNVFGLLSLCVTFTLKSLMIEFRACRLCLRLLTSLKYVSNGDLKGPIFKNFLLSTYNPECLKTY